jgi:hypothetical protein
MSSNARPTARRVSWPGEKEHGKTILEAKLAALNVPLVIFVFKGAAESLLGPLPSGFYGLLPRRQLGRAWIFVMPDPTAATAIESDAIMKLKRVIRSTSTKRGGRTNCDHLSSHRA